MNSNTYEKLQYDELKKIVKSYCVSGLGRQLIDKLEPSSQLKVVVNRQNETTEARKIIDADGNIPFFGITNIESVIDKLEKGMILTPDELVSVSDFLRGCRKIKKFMEKREFIAPVLSGYAGSMSEFMSIEEDINLSIKGGRVDSAASRELKRIRKGIDTVESKITERLNKFLNNSANKTYIQEFLISKRDDCYTIPIKASYKNQVSGRVIEVSSTGSTVFIEPSTVSKPAQELTVLKTEEEIEAYQVLSTLSGTIMAHIYDIRINMELISQYDMLFAKGKFSRHIEGISPEVNDYGKVKLIQCKHPLLSGGVVPLDFEIGRDYRGLIITGPNAGGKTIVLKTVGLNTLAVMSGFHISAEKGTEVAVFDSIFADIGDNQSMENALSTFSSHMKIMSEFIRGSGNNTLVLSDEIGSGTEPGEGAALAVSILEALYKKRTITVATTHYDEIKRYSEQHPDFMNAAMRFNAETLEPLYRLMIGESGESNALFIADKMNIDKNILNQAKRYMDGEAYNLERLDENKIRQPKKAVKTESVRRFMKGDRVLILNQGDTGLIYEGQDQFNNVTVFYRDAFLKLNQKKVQLEMSRDELYPEGYDLDQLFTDYETRKTARDLERGSKKALRKVEKEIRKSRK